MADSGEGTFSIASDSATGILYVPASLVRDSKFHIKDGDPVLFKLDKRGRVIVRKKPIKKNNKNEAKKRP